MEQKIRIAHLLYSGLGGPGSVFFSLASADSSGKYFYSAVFCGIEPLRKEYELSCEKLSIPYVYVPKRRGLDISVYIKLFRQFAKSKPDIVFLHGVSFIWPAVLYKWFYRTGRAVIVRDTQAHHLKSKMEWVWLFFCVLFAGKLVFLTAESADVVKRKFGWLGARKKIIIIPNGLDIDKFLPKDRSEMRDGFKIGMQSRLQPIKDHGTLLKAFKLLKDRNPGVLLLLEIAGDGVTRDQIEKKIDELELRSNVKVLGMLDEPELVNFMQSLDIYVHATLGETLSNSIMQAMACGLPVVASNVWGVSNMICHNENGILYKGGDPANLTDILEQLIRDDKRRKELGARAREYAAKYYSITAMQYNYGKIFDMYKK